MRSYDQYCGLALALDHVGERWTLLIVRELLTGPKRFSDLAAGLPGVASNLLSSRLRAMEGDGLIERRELPPPAACTVYVLTELGRDLEEAVHALVRWGGTFMRRRARAQVFQPQWVGIALQALLGDRRSAPLALTIELPEGTVALRLGEEGIEFAASDRQPDVLLRAKAETILGLAAGELDWIAATEQGLRAEGTDASLQLLRSFLSPSRE